jgi:hypothetical protein
MSDRTPSDGAKRARKSPGTGFPSMPLNAAADVIRKAGAYGYEQSVEALAQYMGHTTTNSGAFKAKIASLRDFGLVLGRGETLALSPLGQTIAHPDDSEAEVDALREAFFNSDVFAKLHATLARGVSLEVEQIGNSAVRNLGIAPSSRQTFVESFVESAVEAGVAERVDDRTIRVLQRGGAASPNADTSSTDGGSVEEQKLGQQQRPTGPQPPPAALHQAWDLGDGQLTIEIRTNRPMPPAAYAQIADVVEATQQLAEILRADGGDDAALVLET